MNWSLKLFVVLASVGQTSAPLLRWTPMKGATLQYDVSVQFMEGKDTIRMKGLALEKVIKVSKDRLNVERVVTELQILHEGRSIPIEDRWIVRREVSPSGVLYSCESPSQSETDVSQLTRLTQVIFPDVPADSAKTWSAEVATGVKKEKVTLTFTSLGTALRKDRKVLKIQVAGGAKPGITVAGTHTVDLATGELLEQDITIGNLSLNDGGKNLQATYSLVKR